MKSDQNKRTENLHTSNDCHFTYMLDLSLSFCRGSRVEGSMSRARVPCQGSRVVVVVVV